MIHFIDRPVSSLVLLNLPDPFSVNLSEDIYEYYSTTPFVEINCVLSSFLAFPEQGLFCAYSAILVHRREERVVFRVA